MSAWHEAGEDAALATIVRAGHGSSLIALLRSRSAAEEAEISNLLEAALKSMEPRGEQRGRDQLLPPRSLLTWRLVYVLAINDMLDHVLFACAGKFFMDDCKRCIFNMLVPSNKVLCFGGSRGILSFLNVTDLQIQFRVSVEQEESIEGIAWSPSRLQVAVAIFEHCVVIDAASGMIDMKMACGDFVMDVAWNPIGSKLAVVTGGSDAAPGMLWLVDVASGHADDIFECDVGIRFVAWSPSGLYVAASARNGIVYVTDIARGQCIMEKDVRFGQDPGDWIARISWIHSSSELAVTCSDGVLVVWGMPSSLLVDEKRTGPFGNVTSQWQITNFKNNPFGATSDFQSGLVLRTESQTDLFCLTELGSTKAKTIRTMVDDFAWSPNGEQVALAHKSAKGVVLTAVDVSAFGTCFSTQRFVEIDGLEQCVHLAWCA
jgi:WD40 repeat protein